MVSIVIQVSGISNYDADAHMPCLIMFLRTVRVCLISHTEHTRKEGVVYSPSNGGSALMWRVQLKLAS